MKIETAKLNRHKGSSLCDERGPLFPPLHVSETGMKAGVRAPPRNKMALFEQFTVPLNRHRPSREATPRNPSTVQLRGNECDLTYISYAMPRTLASTDTISNHEAGMNVKSSYGSSIGSFSSDSAIVNMDESRRIQMQETADDTSPSGMACVQDQRLDEVLEAKSKDESHFEDMQACGQTLNVTGNNFHNCDLSSAEGKGNAKNSTSMEGSHRKAAVSCEGLASAAGSQHPEPENCGTKITNELSAVKIVESSQINSKVQSVEQQHSSGNSADTRQKPRAFSQDGFVCMVNAGDTKTFSSSSQEKATPAAVISFTDPIKPKDVINAVGQRLFWKARKAILRQQEVFSNQVFELHKLIKVQKLLAKVPNMFIDEHMLLHGGSDKACGDHVPNEVISDEQQGNLDNRKTRAPVVHQPGGRQEPYVSKRAQQKFAASEGQDARAPTTNASLPLVFPSTPFSQSCHSLSSDAVSAWGYPMGPLNRPFLFSSSGQSSVPLGTPFGGAYVVGVNLPMASPLAFPCYGGRPEQSMGPGPNNQWPPAPMYRNPYLAPMVNDWFATSNYQGRAVLGSGSDKAGAMSVEMRAEASSHSIHPAVVPSVRQQLGASKLTGTRSHGSAAMAAASVSTPVNVLSRRANGGEQRSRGSSPGVTGSGRMAAEGWGACERETKEAADASARSRKVKDGGQGQHLFTISGVRADASGGSALNLFPLQPSRSLDGQVEGRISRNAGSQGRVIKAVPHSPLTASESAAGILLSIQKERQL